MRPGIGIYLLNVPQVNSELGVSQVVLQVLQILGLCSHIFLLCSVMLVVEMFSVCEFHFSYSPDSLVSLTRLKRKRQTEKGKNHRKEKLAKEI